MFVLTGAVVQAVHMDIDMDPDDPVNMLSADAFAAQHSSWSKNIAQKNIRFMSVTLDTSHFERSLLNEVAPLNIQDMSFTLDTSHLERSPLNETATLNIEDMSATLDTSHSKRSQLNESA